MPVRVRTLRGLDQIPSVREGWLRLLPDARWGVFIHPDWCRALWEGYYPGAEVRFHLAEGDGRLLGILPTCHRRMNRFGLFLPVADAFAGERGDYSLPAMGPSGSQDVLAALLRAAVKSSWASGILVLGNLPNVDSLPDHVREYLRRVGLDFRESRKSCRRIVLGRPFPEVERDFSKSLRSDLRRQERRIQEDVGPLGFRVVHSKDEALELLPSLFAMHDERWVSAGLPGTFSDPAPRRFYQLIIQRMWEAGLHFSLLSCGPRVVAYHVGFIWDDHLLYYKPTFDWQLRNFSPGKLHLKFLVEHGIEEGWKGIDLLQGDEHYKRAWASEETGTVSFIVRTRGLSLGYWWVTRGRRPVQKALGNTYTRLAAWLDKLRLRRARPRS